MGWPGVARLLLTRAFGKRTGPDGTVQSGLMIQNMANVTVILCTYNRCQSLSAALGSVALSMMPDSIDWEVLVVDNNSRDQTREVVEDFSRRYPGRFRYLREPQQGKSYALNSGIREARGNVLAFLDDDVTVDPGWLQSLTAPLRSGEWAGSGGRTIPAQTFTPPDWLALDGPHSMVGILYAHFDLGDKPRELDRAPYGANMAYRKKMFEKYGVFRTDLGPSPNSEIPRPNEDTEFGRRLLAAGERLRYEPAAVVYHPVLENRIQKEYFLDWWFDYGRAMVREWGQGPDIWGIPRPYLNMLAIGIKAMAPSMRRWMLALNPQGRFHWKCSVWMAAGEISEFYRFARGNVTKRRYDARA
jgi:glycosyltransferase involved in cell wall biosynthesis